MGQKEGDSAVVREGLFQIQVCVPSNWNDEQVTRWTNETSLCGTTKGWTIDKDNPNSRERVQCEKFATHVHIILNA